MSRPAVVCHPTTCSPSLEANLADCQVFSVSELSPKWSSSRLKTQPKSSARWFFWSCLLWCWVLHPKKDMILSMQHCCHQVYCLNFYSQSFFWINPNWNSIIAKPIWLIGESIQTEQTILCTVHAGILACWSQRKSQQHHKLLDCWFSLSFSGNPHCHRFLWLFTRCYLVFLAHNKLWMGSSDQVRPSNCIFEVDNG